MGHPGSTDEEIIEDVLRGRMDRYRELVDRYQRAIWKLAYGFVGNFEDAKEISQEGFLKAYRHLGRFHRRSRFSTWLYRIIANQCKDFLRQKARQPRLLSPTPYPNETEDSILFQLADPAGDPSDAAANKELARAISTSIRGLPMKQQTAFILHHLYGMSIEDVSQVMRCRVGTVKAHLFRACENLRAAIAPYRSTRSRS